MSTVKSINGLAAASVKSINGLAIASVKSINGSEVDVLLPYSLADVVNGDSECYARNPLNNTLHGPFGANELRYFDYLDDRYANSFEACVETTGYTETIAGNWPSAFSAVLTADQITAPDPEKLADKLAFGESAGSRVYRNLNATDNTDQTVAVWVRTLSGTKQFRLRFLLKDGTAASSADLTATAQWQRLDFTANILAGGTTPSFWLCNESGGGAGDIYVWGAAVYKDKSFPMAYRTNDTGADQVQAKDQISFAAAAVPHDVMKVSHAFKMIPFYANTTASVPIFYDFYKDSSNYINVRFKAAGDTISVYGKDAGLGDGWKVESGAVTFAACAVLATIELYPTLGKIITSGFTTGNGTVVGTAYDGYITSDKKLYPGSGGNGSNQCNAPISEPKKP